MKGKIVVLLICIYCGFGCNELVEITGIFINRLNETHNCSITMKVTAKNPKSQLLPNILVSVIDDRDSVFVLTPKFTDAGNPVIFNFPEDQIHSISSKASNLVIIIEHPAIGYTTQLIPVAKVYSSSNLNIEFQLDLLPENLAVSNIRNYYLNGYLQSRSMLGIIP